MGSQCYVPPTTERQRGLSRLYPSQLKLVLDLATLEGNAELTYSWLNYTPRWYTRLKTVTHPISDFSDLYLPLAFPPYFLSPETTTSLPDGELQLSNVYTLARLQAQNANTFLINYCPLNYHYNRCHLCSTALITMSMYCILFYYCRNLFFNIEI